ncbi:hypothetical protein QBC44DRAFT_42509 [Cladorrhinum sp. PSN332]|nr:hypothetical protein QBC44DRAFT_42509 [Cladorrhinum sp. PSN332]
MENRAVLCRVDSAEGVSVARRHCLKDPSTHLPMCLARGAPSHRKGGCAQTQWRWCATKSLRVFLMPTTGKERLSRALRAGGGWHDENRHQVPGNPEITLLVWEEDIYPTWGIFLSGFYAAFYLVIVITTRRNTSLDYLYRFAYPISRLSHTPKYNSCPWIGSVLYQESFWLAGYDGKGSTKEGVWFSGDRLEKSKTGGLCSEIMEGEGFLVGLSTISRLCIYCPRWQAPWCSETNL